MQSITSILREAVQKMVLDKHDVLMMACNQRAKFEGWFKFELATALQKDKIFLNVYLEEGYGLGKRADVGFDFQGERWLLELKTVNTNWRAPGLENKNRPITKNITNVVSDIKNLQRLPETIHGLMLFIVFPVPRRIWETEKYLLQNQIGRIELESLLVEKLDQCVDYIPITNDFGVCSYVAQVQ